MSDGSLSPFSPANVARTTLCEFAEPIDFVSTSTNTAVVDASTQHDPTTIPASDHRAVVATITLNQGSESSR